MRKAHSSNVMVQESCSDVFFRKIIAAWKKEWARSVGLGGRMRPAIGVVGKLILAQCIPEAVGAAQWRPWPLPCGMQAQGALHPAGTAGESGFLASKDA